MEKIIEHELQDTWQIDFGVLLKVLKYEVVSTKYYHISSSDRKKVKKMDFYQLKKSLEDGNSFYPKGTFLNSKGQIIRASDDPTKFHYELRTSGGVLHGNQRDFGTYVNAMAIIMSKY